MTKHRNSSSSTAESVAATESENLNSECRLIFSKKTAPFPVQFRRFPAAIQ